jgi:hypothetical protein
MMYSFLHKNKFQPGSVDGEVIALQFPSPADLPPSNYGYHTNNVYDGFPPLMSDSRSLFAAWQPEAFQNQQLLKQSGVRSNWEYRKYLSDNAEKIIRDNFSEAANDIGYFVDEFRPVSANSAGASQWSDHSDLKQLYLSREELQSKRVAPVLTQEELLRIRSGGR